ncbi:MAG: hypothetical protein AABX12_00695 [Nanoarchaeota archaeon]
MKRGFWIVLVVVLMVGVIMFSFSKSEPQLNPSCSGPGCNITSNSAIPPKIAFERPVSYPLFTTSRKLYLNDTINEVVSALTERELPTVLRRGMFNGNVRTAYQQAIIVGGLPQSILSQVTYEKQPTSDQDPLDAIKLGTSPENKVYILTISFTQPINFIHPASIGKQITLFNKQFIVDNRTTSAQLVLKHLVNASELLWLEDGSGVKSGVNQELIEGTLVDFDGNVAQLTNLNIFVAAADSDVNAITQTSPFVDPVFGTFKFEYRGLHIPLTANHPQRESISIFPFGDNELRLNITDYQNNRKVLPFVKAESGVLKLANGDKKINVIEMKDAYFQEYVVVGNGRSGGLVQIDRIYNSSSGFEDDEIVFQDFFSERQINAIITAEGIGTVVFGGKTYNVNYYGAATSPQETRFIRLNYPDSPDSGRGIFFPTIETSKGAQFMFYEPTYMNLRTLPSFYGGSVGGSFYLMLSDGDHYADEVVFNPVSNGYYQVNTSTGMYALNTSRDSTQITVPIGKINYMISGTGILDRALIHLDVRRDVINNPAIVIFEEIDDSNQFEALTVKTEGNGTDNGLGVEDIETSWGGDDVFDEIRFESNRDLYGSADRYGSLVLTDRTNSDQYSASIYYPDEQAYAQVYITELF